jgi:hypothetical protein
VPSSGSRRFPQELEHGGGLALSLFARSASAAAVLTAIGHFPAPRVALLPVGHRSRGDDDVLAVGHEATGEPAGPPDRGWVSRRSGLVIRRASRDVRRHDPRRARISGGPPLPGVREGLSHGVRHVCTSRGVEVEVLDEVGPEQARQVIAPSAGVRHAGELRTQWDGCVSAGIRNPEPRTVVTITARSRELDPSDHEGRRRIRSRAGGRREWWRR